MTSYAGCDGGDPVNSNIWLVGIKWGYANEDKLPAAEHQQVIHDYHHKTILAEIEQGYREPCNARFSLKDNLEYTFGRNTAKLITAIK